VIQLGTSGTISKPSMNGEAWSRAALRVMSEILDPDEVTARVGIDPTEAHARGTPKSRRDPRSARRRSSIWLLESGLPRTASLREHLDSLSRSIRPHLRKFTSLTGEATIDFFIGLNLDPGQSSFEIDDSFLQMCGVLHAKLIFDLYTPD
jgi:Domain of unknown function (DUF4279)